MTVERTERTTLPVFQRFGARTRERGNPTREIHVAFRCRAAAICVLLVLAPGAFSIDAAGPFYNSNRQVGDPYYVSLEAALETFTSPCQYVVSALNRAPSNPYNPQKGCFYTQYNLLPIECDMTTPYTGPHVGPYWIHRLLPPPGGTLSLADPGPLPAPQQAHTSCEVSDPKLPDPFRNAGYPKDMCPLGNPINPATGNKVQREVDFELPGHFPIIWARYYNSDPDWYPIRSDLGRRWTHEYQRSVIFSSGFNPDRIYLVRHDGRIYALKKASGSSWTNIDYTNTSGSLNDLDGVFKSKTGGGWLFYNEKSEVEEYNSSGHLVSITKSSGAKLAFTLNTAGQITEVKDGFNNVRVRITYAAVGNRITDIVVPDEDGAWYSYSYQDAGETNFLLSSVTYPDADDDGTEATRANNSYRDYLYAEPAHMHDPTDGPAMYPGALTGIEDDGLGRFGTYKYDAEGRAWSTEHAGGADRVTLAFGEFNPTTGIGSTDVTDALGHVGTQTYQVDHREARITAVDGTGAWCSTRPDTVAYNTWGYPQSKTDFNGNKTLYAYTTAPSLALGPREICRLEGIPPASSTDDADKAFRLTTTAWDATAQLPSLVTTWEPVNPTMASPTSCPVTPDPAVWRKRREVETVFVPGTGKTNQRRVRSFFGSTQDEAERVTTFTYFTDTAGDLAPLLGMLKRIDGPRTDVDDFTDFAYITESTKHATNHPSIGDLWQVSRKVDATLSITTEITRHDPLGRPLEVSERNGTLVTTYQYHPRGWLASHAVAGQDPTAYMYDTHGALTKVTLPDGSYLRYESDEAGRVRDIFDGEGNQIHYERDALGNATVEETKDPAGVLKRKVARVFDDRNRVAKLTTGDGASSQSTAYIYNANGTLATEIDPRDPFPDPSNQNPTIARRFRHDALGRQRQLIDPENGESHATETVYDVNDAIVSVNDPAGLPTTYERNGFAELKTLLSRDTGETTFTYDLAGNVATKTDARNITAAMDYDALGRRRSVDYPGTTEDITYTYDESTAGAAQHCNVPRNGVGQLTSVTDGSGTTKYYFDVKGDVTCKEVTTVGDSWATDVWVTRYGYDEMEQLTAVTYPSGMIVAYSRDSNGRIDGVQANIGGQWQTVVSGAKYRPFGPLEYFEQGANAMLMTARSYDLSYRLQGIATYAGSSMRALWTYAHDAADNVTFINDGVAQESLLMTHDALSRVTRVDSSFSGQTDDGYGWVYWYDKNGNRTSKRAWSYGTPVESIYLTETGTNALASTSEYAYTRDATGNVERIDSTTTALAYFFEYGASGRPRSFGAEFGETPLYLFDLKHNAMGQRSGISYSANPQIDQVLMYDESGKIIADRGYSGYRYEYIYLDDMLVAHVRYPGPYGGGSAAVYYSHLNRSNVPEAGSNASGGWAWYTNPYTEPFHPYPYVEIAPRVTFPGQYVINHSMPFRYNYHRDYDGATGRYLQSDPIGLAGGINTYAYANNNPVRFTDPLGLVPNPAEAACLLGPNPVCVAGIGIDIATSLIGLAGLAAISSISGDTLEDCDDDDFCYQRWLEEERRCNNWSFLGSRTVRACKSRATTRWDLCNRNSGKPDPSEPPEWSPSNDMNM